MAVYDELTGIYNRRHFYRLAKNQLKELPVNGRPVSLLILQIKPIESECEEDELYKTTASILEDSLRTSDILGRLDDHHFSIILPDADCNTAEQVSERIAKTIIHSSLHAESYSLHFGLYCSEKPEDTCSLETMITRAQEALDEAVSAKTTITIHTK